jgi:hypothetical protein
LNFYSCPTALDRSLCVCIYTYITTTIGKCIDFSSSSFPFSSFFPVLITRATASVYSHEADGGTLHLIYMYICSYLSVETNGTKKKKRTFNRVIMRRKKNDALFCLYFLSTNTKQIQLDRSMTIINTFTSRTTFGRYSNTSYCVDRRAISTMM